ncbi:6-phosphofructokinase [Aureococcus anophagefferens]|nr:6-phosphofructokinase [Aureococcus anophagefferens]
MADALEAAGVDALFVVGGDGTIRGASYLCEELESRGSKISVAAIPKTIDNDIPLIDRSFGFDTAVAEAKRAIDVAVVEARSFPSGLGVASVPADTIFCSRLAAHACHGAMAGYTAFAVGTVNSHFAEIPLSDFENRAAITSVTGRLFQDLVRSTGQPQFTQAADYACDDDLESPSGGCVVTWAGESTTGVQPV